MDGHDDSNRDWKNVPSHHLGPLIEAHVLQRTKWVVFEPNDEALWQRIRSNVGEFMMDLFRQGAFKGRTPEYAFYVKCDAEINPPEDRERGIVNIQIGFAPLRPADFIVIRIQQTANET